MTGTRYLWLLRHGKAASDAPSGGGDRERPLTDRGRRDASALGARLGGGPPALGLEGVPVPEQAICSAAVRTSQTADLVADAMADAGSLAREGRLPVEAFRSLYGAGTEMILRYVREVDDGVSSLLVVGHNPTLPQLAWELLAEEDEGSPGDRAVLDGYGFPTCSLAVLSLDVPGWEDVVRGCATLAGLFTPPY
jgi:phosphohistidine phosphatase